MNRAIVTWIYVFIMIGVVIVLWYLTQPIVYTIIDKTAPVAREMGANTTGYEQGISLIGVVNIVWPGFFIILFLIYGFLASSEKEGISYYR